jgi:hypothetical protein
MLKYNSIINKNSNYTYNNYYANFNLLDKKVSLEKNELTLNNYTNFFAKKESSYTKLKYSRVPQFDITSGAVAGLLAGLLGFLITEKFGFELIDSADFFTVIMYTVIIAFTIHTLLSHYENSYIVKKCANSVLNLLVFYSTIIIFSLK